jgi:hypothetical protein
MFFWNTRNLSERLGSVGVLLSLGRFVSYICCTLSVSMGFALADGYSKNPLLSFSKARRTVVPTRTTERLTNAQTDGIQSEPVLISPSHH